MKPVPIASDAKQFIASDAQKLAPEQAVFQSFTARHS